MDKKIFTVSVGIPAYNEEANIKHLLSALLSQKEDGFILKEIIVASDGSNDSTVAEVQSLASSKVVVIDNKDRKGQAERQNDILKLFRSDILVLLNADVLPTNEYFLREIVKPFYNNEKVGIVGARLTPLKAKVFFESVISFSSLFKRGAYEQINNGDTVYLCHGAVRAFSRAFTNVMHWPQVISEDAFSYFECKRQGFHFEYTPRAEVYYRCAQTFYDHVKQSIRFLGGIDDLVPRFPNIKVKDAHRIPFMLMCKSIFEAVLKHPILLVSYSMIYVVAVFARKLNYYKPTTTWEPSQSTKKLF